MKDIVLMAKASFRCYNFYPRLKPEAMNPTTFGGSFSH